MSVRELVVLGTASQMPTRLRNHNGYLLRWDGEGILFDPGEGTQRQMVYAGVSTADITRVCITHFHGDHCLGLPGVLQRRAADSVPGVLPAHFPGSGQEYFTRLRHASAFRDATDIAENPIISGGVVATGSFGTLSAHRLDHPVETYGYRLVERDARRLLTDRLRDLGITGPDVGRLRREGSLARAGRRVSLAEVSEPRPGQRFAFVMDTRLCDAVYSLADGVDLLVIEATFLDADARLADAYGHLTARQAAEVAAASGVRRLVLSHFSQRYRDARAFYDEATRHFTGEIVVASDLDRVAVPPRP